MKPKLLFKPSGFYLKGSSPPTIYCTTNARRKKREGEREKEKKTNSITKQKPRRKRREERDLGSIPVLSPIPNHLSELVIFAPIFVYCSSSSPIQPLPPIKSDNPNPARDGALCAGPARQIWRPRKSYPLHRARIISKPGRRR